MSWTLSMERRKSSFEFLLSVLSKSGLKSSIWLWLVDELLLSWRLSLMLEHYLLINFIWENWSRPSLLSSLSIYSILGVFYLNLQFYFSSTLWVLFESQPLPLRTYCFFLLSRTVSQVFNNLARDCLEQVLNMA